MEIRRSSCWALLCGKFKTFLASWLSRTMTDQCCGPQPSSGRMVAGQLIKEDEEKRRKDAQPCGYPSMLKDSLFQIYFSCAYSSHYKLGLEITTITTMSLILKSKHNRTTEEDREKETSDVALTTYA